MATDLDARIDQFLRDNELRGIIAITGGASDDDTKDDHIRSIVKEFIEALTDKGFAIAGNGTKWGVPLYTVQFAKELAIPIIRIYPEKAKKYLLEGDYGLDVSIPPRVLSSEWGDDSEVLIKVCSGIIFIAGGTGTQIEFAHWAKINEGRVSRNERIIYGVPIYGAGGWTEAVYDKVLPMYSKISACFPQEKTLSGKQAAEYLLRKMAKT